MYLSEHKQQLLHIIVILAAFIVLFSAGHDPARTDPLFISIFNIFSLYCCSYSLIRRYVLRSNTGIDAFDSFSLSTICYITAIMWVKLWGGISSHGLPSLTIVAATLMFCLVLLYGIFWMIKQRAMKSILLRILGSLWVAGIMAFSLYVGMIGIGHSIFVIFG